MLPEEENSILLRTIIDLEKDMEPNHLMAHMISHRIFTDDDVERVKDKTTRSARVAEFLLTYKRKAQSLGALKDALLFDGLNHLAAKLDGSSQTDGKGDLSLNAGQLRVRLTGGGVPGKPSRHVERSAQQSSLGDALVRNATNASFWVVLHGMAGCGKTTLCSDVLRSDPRLIGDAFQNVFWVTVQDAPGNSQGQKLFTVMHRLHTRLATGQYADAKLDDVENVQHFLRRVILTDYPNLLLVLDDVWSADVIHAFDALQCRILATTRNKSLFNEAHNHVEYVAMNPIGFTRAEALNVLAQYANCKPIELPGEASAIFQLCDGHPLVINLIGSLIREHEDRWQRYYEELKVQHLDDIEHKSAYHYSTFYKAAKISCDDLTPEQLNNFYAFAIFPLGVLIPDAVLAAIRPGDAAWKEKLIKVQDEMLELRDRSLIEEFVEPSVDQKLRRRRFYSLHFLIHAYLKRFRPSEQRATQTQCRELVEKLQTALHNQTRDFAEYDLLEQFLYTNLGYFLYKASMRDHFPLFFLNLAELIRRLRWSNPSTILVEFHLYNSWISRWDPLKMEAFLKFFRRNASHLRRARGEIDAVQLGLAEASPSPVREQAKRMAAKLLENDLTDSILLLEPIDSESTNRDCLILDGYIAGGSLFSALFLDPTGTLFVACSRQNRDLLVCDASSGRTVQRIKLSGVVDKLSVSDSKSLVITFHNDSRVLLFDVTAEPIVADLESLPDMNVTTPLPVLLYLEDGVHGHYRHSSVEDDATLSEEEQTPTAVWPNQARPNDCAISASGRRVAVLLEDSLTVYDKKTRSAVFQCAVSTGKDDRMAFIDDDTLLVSRFDGSFVVVTKTLTTTFRLNDFEDSKVRAFAVLADQVVVGDWQKRLFLRRLHDDWQTTTPLHAGVASPWAVAASSTIGLCAAGLTDCSVQLFRVADGHLLPISTLRGHGRPVQSVHFGDHRLISTADDDTVVVWKISRSLTDSSKTDKMATMTASQRCADRFVAASLLNDGSFMIRSSCSPARDISQTLVSDATCMAVAAAARFVAFGTQRATLEIFSQTNLERPPLIVHLSSATKCIPAKLAMTTDGAFVAVIGMDGQLAVVSLQDGHSPAILSHSMPSGSVVDAQFDTDGTRLFVTTDQGLIRVLCIPSMEPAMECRVTGVGSIAIVRLVSTSEILLADESGVVGLVDLSSNATFLPIADFTTGQLVDLRCSPCLRYILCLSRDAVSVYDRHARFALVASVPCCDGSAVYCSDHCDKLFLIGREADFHIYNRLRLS